MHVVSGQAPVSGIHLQRYTHNRYGACGPRGLYLFDLEEEPEFSISSSSSITVLGTA